MSDTTPEKDSNSLVAFVTLTPGEGDAIDREYLQYHDLALRRIFSAFGVPLAKTGSLPGEVAITTARAKRAATGLRGGEEDGMALDQEGGLW